MKIIYLPIEPLEERYSAQMLRWVVADFGDLELDYRIVLPESSYKKINNGQWLDTFGTSIYRAQQLEAVAKMFSDGEVLSGDIFLIGDVWFQGIGSIKMMAELAGIDVKVVGWHYAGMFDPHDLLTKKLSAWAIEWERWLIGYLDAVCVGSEFHRGLIVNGVQGSYPYHLRSVSHVRPFGLSWKPDEVSEYKREDRQKIVVFPHRYADEKQPKNFDQLAVELSGYGWDFVYSTNNDEAARQARRHLPHVEVVKHNTKDEYYQFLSTCGIYYSAGLQETFGYSLHESIAMGLAVVAPTRCSYVEGLMGDARFLYDEDTDPLGRSLLSKMMSEPISVPYEYTKRYENSCKDFIRYCLDQFA